MMRPEREIVERIERVEFDLDTLRQDYRAHIRTGNASGFVFLFLNSLALAWLFLKV